MPAPELIESQFERFRQLLRAQAELYRTLIGLARKQAKEIAARQIDEFIHVLEEKRTVLQEIESIELLSAPLRNLWETENHRAAEPTRAGLREVVEEIRGLLEELLELESHSQRELGQAKELVEEELRQVTAGPDAIRSYRGTIQCKPRFMNETG
jgi:arsenate reductase-like glutaredoxin family protein